MRISSDPTDSGYEEFVRLQPKAYKILFNGEPAGTVITAETGHYGFIDRHIENGVNFWQDGCYMQPTERVYGRVELKVDETIFWPVPGAGWGMAP